MKERAGTAALAVQAGVGLPCQGDHRRRRVLAAGLALEQLVLVAAPPAGVLDGLDVPRLAGGLLVLRAAAVGLPRLGRLWPAPLFALARLFVNFGVVGRLRPLHDQMGRRHNPYHLPVGPERGHQGNRRAVGRRAPGRAERRRHGRRQVHRGVGRLPRRYRLDRRRVGRPGARLVAGGGGGGQLLVNLLPVVAAAVLSGRLLSGVVAVLPPLGRLREGGEPADVVVDLVDLVVVVRRLDDDDAVDRRGLVRRRRQPVNVAVVDALKERGRFIPAGLVGYASLYSLWLYIYIYARGWSLRVWWGKCRGLFGGLLVLGNLTVNYTRRAVAWCQDR